MYADRLVLFVFASLLTSERCELLAFPALPVSGHRYADRLVLFVFAPLLTSDYKLQMRDESQLAFVPFAWIVIES